MPIIQLNGNNNTLWADYDYTKLNALDGDYVYADEDNDGDHQEWNVSSGNFRVNGIVELVNLTIYHRFVDVGGGNSPIAQNFTVNFNADGWLGDETISTVDTDNNFNQVSVSWTGLSIAVPDFINLILQIDCGSVAKDLEYQVNYVKIEVFGSDLEYGWCYPWDVSHICEQYLLPDQDKPSYFGPTGVPDFPSVDYSGNGYGWENSQGLSYYTPSGVNSFASYVGSGYVNPDDGTYLVFGGSGDVVQNFSFQSSPIYGAPLNMHLFLRTSGLLDNDETKFYLGNYIDTSQTNLEVRLVGPTGEYAVLGNLSTPYSGVVDANSYFTWNAGTIFNKFYNKECTSIIGFNIERNSSGINQARDLGLFESGVRTEVLGAISVVDSSGDPNIFAFSEIMLRTISYNCGDFNPLTLHISGSESVNNNTDLFIESIGDDSGNVPLNIYSNFINDNVELYVNNIADTTGVLNLFIPGPSDSFAPGNSGLDLYLQGGGQYDTFDNDNSPTLYLISAYSSGEGVNLFISGGGFGEANYAETLYISGSITNNNIPLYLETKFEESGNTSLFTTSFYEDSGNMNLYLDQEGGVNRFTRTLFVEGKYDNSGNIPLFIGSASQSGNMPLFVQSRDFIPSGVDSLELFTFSQTGDYLLDSIPLFAYNGNEAEMNLFIKSTPYGEINDSLNLFLTAHSGDYSKNLFDLYLHGAVQSNSGVSMFMPNPGKIDYSNNMNLFINRAMNSTASNHSLYLQSILSNSDNFTLYISGVPELNDNLTLFIDSTAFESGNPTLYTHGI